MVKLARQRVGLIPALLMMPVVVAEVIPGEKVGSLATSQVGGALRWPPSFRECVRRCCVFDVQE
jgi:hypothetical protein